MKVELKRIAFSSFNRYNFLRELNLTLPEFQALKKLSANKDIVIHKSDKGNSVVIVDKKDYITKLQELVADPEKFEKVDVKDDKDYSFMTKQKEAVDEVLRNLLKKKSISEYEKKKLSPDGPNPARLYGSPKIHKPLVNGLPKYRPIISQIGTCTYELAKFLLPFITPHTTNNYTVTDTFHFVSMLENKDHRLFMASLDVDSLFTNIPLDETIDIVTNKVYAGVESVNGLMKSDFRKLLSLSTQGAVFYFNGSYYRQTDGVAMGSPLGPALANAFLCHHEQHWLDDCPLVFAPVFYARYVDDIFVLLRSREHVQRLAHYLSSQHPNINFTFEIEDKDCLPFLDVRVFRDANNFSTSVHRKDTFSGVFTNYAAFMPETYKKGLISTLLFRAYTINSSLTGLHDEIEKLKSIFHKNGYPPAFIDRCVLRFFDKIHIKKVPVHTVPKMEVSIILPFLGTTSANIKNNIVKSFKNILPFCNIKIIYKTTNRLSTYFKYKDAFPKSLASGVLYKYTCAKCKLSYIGYTARYWEKRLEEHTHISARTGKPLSGMQIFAPMQHTRKAEGRCGKVSRDDFKFIGGGGGRYLLQIKESLMIQKLNPELNGSVTSVPIHLF